MKDVTFTVEFTQHVLANGVGPTGKRDMFQRNTDDKLVFQQSWWFSAFRRAIEMERVRGIKASDISMDLFVAAPTQMFKRRYGRNNSRTHEAIMPGTQVTFSAVVEDRVTESTLRRLLQRMGRFIGLSPYGHKLGYGHFQLINMDMEPSEPAIQGRANGTES